MQKPHILFYVQHLLGIGHIKRASLLVRGWLAAGMKVTVVSGGEAVPQFGFEGAVLVQLPAVRAADAHFSGLIDSSGASLSEQFKQQRLDQLLAAFEASAADVVVIENYPFGRRQLRWELEPLLDKIALRQPRPLLISSVRDILQSRKPERVRQTISCLQASFDYVLVHGDPGFISLQDSFPAAVDVQDKLIYTGYVTDQPFIGTETDDGEEGWDEVLVSAGGGAVGFSLMQAALQCKRETALAGLTWRFLLGPNLSDAERQRLRSLADSNCILEPIRPDFPNLLKRCRLSISQAGYNTVMDLLAAACPAVLVPFEGSAETEQLQRSLRLSELGLCTLVRESELDAAYLAAAIERAIATVQPSARTKKSLPPPIDLNGALNGASQIEGLWRSYRQRQQK